MKDKVLTEAEIAAELRTLPHWAVKDGTIARVCKTHGWRATLMVVNAIGHLAEAAWHHPDLSVSYGQVEVRLSSHDARGITAKDFALARRIEEVVFWQPGRDGGPLEGPPAKEGYLKFDDG